MAPRTGARPLRPGVIIVIPTYDHGDQPARAHTIRTALKSVAAQRVDFPVRVVIADNGLEVSQVSDIAALSVKLGLALDFVDARPHGAAERTAGHARNVACRWICLRAISDPDYRLDTMFFLDDDCALLPGALAAMDRARRRRPDAVAITAENIQVPVLDDASLAAYQASAAPANDDEGPVQLMPALVNEDCVDMASIVAFSGQVATKTNCLLLDAAAVQHMVADGVEPMVGGPHGTGEDMMLSLGMQRLGRVYSCLQARVLDREPGTDGVLTQRSRFGRDHVALHDQLVRLGYGREGLQVLEPRDDGWVEWFAPRRGVHGVLVHPEQLKRLSWLVTSQLAEGGMVAALGAGSTREKICMGVVVLERALREVDQLRARATPRARPDLPAPAVTSPAAVRWSKASRVAQLAGNLLGLHDVHQQLWTNARSFLFGVRQAVCWRGGGQSGQKVGYAA